MLKSGLKDKQNNCRTWTHSIFCLKELQYIMKRTFFVTALNSQMAVADELLEFIRPFWGVGA